MENRNGLVVDVALTMATDTAEREAALARLPRRRRRHRITLGAGNIQLSCNDVIELLEKRLGTATKKNLVRIDESSATVAR